MSWLFSIQISCKGMVETRIKERKELRKDVISGQVCLQLGLGEAQEGDRK